MRTLAVPQQPKTVMDQSTQISIIIVEDEPLIAADLANQLRKSKFNVLETFESGEEIIKYLKQESTPDVILMDVQLEGNMDGIDTAHYINKSYDLPIIFLTSNTDGGTFDRAKISSPHAFLSKPFRINDVVHAVELATENKSEKSDDDVEFMDDRVFIKTSHALEKVLHSQILYLEAQGAYTKLITEGKEFILCQTLKKTETKLIAKQFFKTHRSFIVNIHNVDRISEGSVYTKEHKIPVSRSFREELYKLFTTI